MNQLEIKISMLFNLGLLFNSYSYHIIFNSIAELVFLIGMPTKEEKAERETHPVIAEVK